jgi:hypothetical protein
LNRLNSCVMRSNELKILTVTMLFKFNYASLNENSRKALLLDFMSYRDDFFANRATFVAESA